MVHGFDYWFLDSFIAKREMPGTNGEEENIPDYSISQCHKWLAGGVYIDYKL
jgi:hypothetical protein